MTRSGAPFWSGGISNPIEVIEQITYLLFLKRLDELHTLEENKANRLKQPIEKRIFPKGKDKIGDGLSYERTSTAVVQVQWRGRAGRVVHDVAVSRVLVCFGQDLKGIRLGSECEVSFVATALRTGSKWLLERARGINTEGLTLDHLRAFPLVPPPPAAQREFTRRSDAVEKLKLAQRRSLTELDALFASLQHRAFRGEL